MNDDNYKHQSWCFKNNYIVYTLYINKNRFKLVVEKEGIQFVLDDEYTKKEITKVIWDMYTKIFNKNNKIDAITKKE